jgi:hypothetical protein
VKDPDRLLRQLYARPRDAEIDERKQRFAAINDYVTKRGGWMVSIPGAREMRIQVLPGSVLPGQLAEPGYIVTRTGQSERVLAHAMRIVAVEVFELRAP